MTNDTVSTLAMELRHSTGSEEFYDYPLQPDHVYTEGVQYLAQQAGAYWLLDEIFLQQAASKFQGKAFQLWKLTVDEEKRSAVLTCNDGNGNNIYNQRIPCMDFPLPKIKLYLVDKTLLLPSEY